MRPGVLALLTAPLLLIGPPAADACMCLRDATACQSVASAAAVFEGTVAAIEPAVRRERSNGRDVQIHERLIRFTDVRAWRGEAPGDVVTGVGAYDCGYPFVHGTRYLVVAYTEPPDGRLTTSICAQTRPLAEAANLLAYLESLARPSTGARLWGRVAMASMGPTKGVGGARVAIEGPRTVTTTVGADGRFTIDALPSGEYRVRVELPANRTDLEPIEEQSLRLEGDRACGELEFRAMSNGRVEGEVLDASGRPMRGVFVTLQSTRAGVPYGAGSWGATTNSDGQYAFESVAAGRYVVGINIDRGPASGLDVTYGTVGGKPTIDLAAGARLVVDPMVGRRVERFAIHGHVRTSTGDPVPDAIVRGAAFGKNGLLPAQAEARTDAYGNFLLTLWRGARYRVEARGVAGRAFVDVAVNDKPIVLTLKLQ